VRGNPFEEERVGNEYGYKKTSTAYRWLYEANHQSKTKKTGMRERYYTGNDRIREGKIGRSPNLTPNQVCDKKITSGLFYGLLIVSLFLGIFLFFIAKDKNQ
jgi:hypothetical protein